MCAYQAAEFNYECGLKALPGEPMCFWHTPKGDMKTADIYRQYLGNEKRLTDTLHGFPENQLIGFQMPGISKREKMLYGPLVDSFGRRSNYL
jgi:hypothetical protein